MNRLRRFNSTTSTRSRSSLASLEDIVHEEDEILHSDNDLQNWSIPKPDKNWVGIKPLTRRGINAAVLLRLLDGRFTCHKQGLLGMVEANISKGPIHFNVDLDFTISRLYHKS